MLIMYCQDGVTCPYLLCHRRKWNLGARVDILFLREMTVLCPDLSFSIDVQIQNTSLVPRLVP